MIIFYTSDTEEVILASVVKHFNQDALLREYKDNNEVIGVAKMYEESHFIRIKDYKRAIKNKYNIPAWVKNESRVKFLELALAHKETTTNEIISYVAKYLFNPEELFYSSLDKPRLFHNRVKEVKTELNVFKRGVKHFKNKGLDYYEINPEHKISKLFMEYLLELFTEPFILLTKKKALVGNALLLGFNKKVIKTTRYDALKLKKKMIINQRTKNSVKRTIATRICEY